MGFLGAFRNNLTLIPGPNDPPKSLAFCSKLALLVAESSSKHG